MKVTQDCMVAVIMRGMSSIIMSAEAYVINNTANLWNNKYLNLRTNILLVEGFM
jgi:hypothetical protein